MQLRPQISLLLSLQYKTTAYPSPIQLPQLLTITQTALHNSIIQLNYNLSAAHLHHYNIIIPPSTIDPYTTTERDNLKQLLQLCQTLSTAKDHTVITNTLNLLNQLILTKHNNQIYSPYYQQFAAIASTQLYIDVKQAMIYTVLSQCQIWYTIIKQRKKSMKDGKDVKEFHLDPLIKYFDNIVKRCQLVNPFHTKVLPRKQVKHIEKKDMDRKAKNILFEAVSNRNYTLVKELILKGADLQAMGIQHDRCEKFNRQLRCAHKACANNDLQMCKILTSYGVNWQSQDTQLMTPIFYAVQSAQLPLIRYLVQQIGVNLQKHQIQSRTPFYFACTEAELNVVKYLQARGGDINNKSSLGRTALSKSCYLGRRDIASFLLKCPGIIPQSQDKKGRTALHNAVFGPKGGRQGHKFGTNSKDSPECAQMLLENGFFVDFPDIQGNTPLHVALSSDGLDSVRILIAYGASLWRLNKYGETPILTGSKFGHLDGIKMLYEEYNSPINHKDLFKKNLILLCAKFRQMNQTGKQGAKMNPVYPYMVDKLVKHLANQTNYIQTIPQLYTPPQFKALFEPPPIQLITNPQQQLIYTFKQLLTNNVMEQFIYFVKVLFEEGITIPSLSIDELLLLLEMHENVENIDDKQVIGNILCYEVKQNEKLYEEDQKQLLKWMMKRGSIYLFDVLKQWDGHFQQRFIINSKHLDKQIGFRLFSEQWSTILSMLPQTKQKILTYLLLKMDINWPYYRNPTNGQNILHILVRNRKIGTLLQLLKVLTIDKIDFVENKYLTKISSNESELTLRQLLNKLMSEQDDDAVDPYQLSLIMKQASAIKILQQRLKESSLTFSHTWHVNEYFAQISTSQTDLQQYKLYETEDQLRQLLIKIQTDPLQTLCHVFPLLHFDPSLINQVINIDNYLPLWQDIHTRPLFYLYKQSQLSQLQAILSTSLLGIDIEYFHSNNNHTLISILQLSTLSADYIIDMLICQCYQQFVKELKQYLHKLFSATHITKIMHGADNDLCIIKSVFNLSIVNFIDTSRVDAELRKNKGGGVRGLATLANEYLHIEMNKDYQVSQWRMRPIPIAMIEYARKDSLVLLFLARRMIKGILETIKTDQTEQSVAQLLKLDSQSFQTQLKQSEKRQQTSRLNIVQKTQDTLLSPRTDRQLRELLSAGCSLARRNRRANGVLVENIKLI